MKYVGHVRSTLDIEHTVETVLKRCPGLMELISSWTYWDVSDIHIISLCLIHRDLEPCKSVKSSTYVVLGAEERSWESSMILDPFISTVKQLCHRWLRCFNLLVSSGFCQCFRIWELPRIYKMLKSLSLPTFYTILLWHFSGKSLLSLRVMSWIYISTWMKNPKRQERILLENIKQPCDL